MSTKVEKNKTKKKFIIGGTGILVIILIIATILSLTSNPKKVNKVMYPELARAMTYEQVQEGDEKVQIENADGEVVDFDYVQFDAFFLRDLDGDGYAEGIRGTCKEVGKEDILYMELNVLTKGYLKDGKIEIKNNNFYFNSAIVKDSEIKENYIG